MGDDDSDDGPIAAADGRAWRNFYGRIRGKTMRAAQKSYIADDLGRWELRGASRADNPGRTPIDIAALSGGRPVWLEIGFGGGEHLVAMAARYPDVFLIGCEVFVNGIAMLLGKIRGAGVTNLALYPADVRDVLDVLPPGSVAKAFLNYPDPWPKRRHHRRRFVTPDHLAPLHRAMAPGTELRVATDIPDYVRQTLHEVPAAGFSLVCDSPAPWADWPSTRYEQKALREGRVPRYLTFARG